MTKSVKTKLKRHNSKYIESESSDSDLDSDKKNPNEEEKRLVPGTFEGMMESFGVNLERKSY